MLTSIIILTYNKLDYTKLCIESIRKYTDPGDYEIIVVDNGSTDGTVDWLRQQLDIRLIENKENVGFPKGCNQGIRVAQGNNILLLNNDTVVTVNWLNNLVKCLYSSKEIGAVGPVTNSCSYRQDIPVNYKTLEEMQEFAYQYNQANPKKWEERIKLVGFCMLIKKEVVDKIGYLDERFSPGNFEDDDYSLRIRMAGYKNILCKDTFIHHFGSTSWKDNPTHFFSILQTNEQKFQEKWGFNSKSFTINFDLIAELQLAGMKEPKILEVNCGTGATLLQIRNQYKNAVLYGIEHNKATSALIKDIADVVKVCDINTEKLFFPTNFFDYIIISNMDHVNRLQDVFMKLHPHLKESGELLIWFENANYFQEIKDMLIGGSNSSANRKNKFYLSEIYEALKHSGYKVINIIGKNMGISEADEQFIQALCMLSRNPDMKKQFSSYAFLVKSSRN